MILRLKGIGQYKVKDLAAASAIYCIKRDASSEGGSIFPVGVVVDGKRTYYVSYNGKVWNGRQQDWKSGDVPVYNPYGPVAA